MKLSLSYDLVLKPSWTCEDIMNALDCSRSEAFKIKERAIKEHNGIVPYSRAYVTSDSVLALFGTSREKEFKLLKYGR